MANNINVSFIDTGFFKLDGGAMFGVVPKRMWNKINPADENNMCTWAMRCLLIETPTRKILVDTGLGNKQGEKFFSHFLPHGDANLMDSLAQKGIMPEDITDVFLTHLHFDHCGEAVIKNEFGELIPAFPNATFWSNQAHYDWAFTPNARERASFLKENFVPLKEHGVLEFIDVNPTGLVDWHDGIRIQTVYGHTEAMMLLHIPYGNHQLVYCADLVPSAGHVGIPYVMAYDIRPLITMQENTAFLRKAIENNYLLLFEHDPVYPSATVTYNDRGRVVIRDYVNLDIF